VGRVAGGAGAGDGGGPDGCAAAACSLVRLRLLTGRTHQIRVHMAHIGHPVLGDALYGEGPTAGATRQMLHAGALAFRHPRDGRPLRFEAPLPDDFADMIKSLQNMGDHNGKDGAP